VINGTEWKKLLAPAARGDADAADRVAALLLDWTQKQLPATIGSDEEDQRAGFVAHMVRDQFAHLPDRPPHRLEAFLRMSWRHFIINWYSREQHRRSWQIPWADWAKMEDENEDEVDMDCLAGAAPSPEQTVLLRAEVAALRAEVAQLSGLKQRIFTFCFEEELSEREIALRLDMNPSTVRWHVHALRQHLKKWRQAWEG
jgi:RNA polymerase sigma factor (sigma-70 family)